MQAPYTFKSLFDCDKNGIRLIINYTAASYLTFLTMAGFFAKLDTNISILKELAWNLLAIPVWMLYFGAMYLTQHLVHLCSSKIFDDKIEPKPVYTLEEEWNLPGKEPTFPTYESDSITWLRTVEATRQKRKPAMSFIEAFDRPNLR